MYKLVISKEMLIVISDALGNGPFRVVAPVMAELQRQIREQELKSNGQDDRRGKWHPKPTLTKVARNEPGSPLG